MKTIILIIGFALIIVLGTSSVIKNFASGIHGIVTPVKAVKKVWAINATDSFAVIPSSGNYSFDLKAGTWQIHAQAIPPYKDVTLENITVKENGYTDAGEIKLPVN
jgi:hypothetical protein